MVFAPFDRLQARKTLAHQQLVAEVLTQLSFFKPDPKVNFPPYFVNAYTSVKYI